MLILFVYNIFLVTINVSVQFRNSTHSLANINAEYSNPLMAKAHKPNATRSIFNLPAFLFPSLPQKPTLLPSSSHNKNNKSYVRSGEKPNYRAGGAPAGGAYSGAGLLSGILCVDVLFCEGSTLEPPGGPEYMGGRLGSYAGRGMSFMG